MGDYEPRSKDAKRSTATAGPSADDRFGSGLVGQDLRSRILGVSVAGDRTRVVMSLGRMQGVHVGMEGYIRGPDGLLSELQIDQVEMGRCHAFVDVTPDELQKASYVMLNPTSIPRHLITKDVTARIIGVSVQDGQTRITIARGSSNGAAIGMKGHLVAEDGREGDDITIAYTTARQSFATIKNTPDYLRQFPRVLLKPRSSTPVAPVQRRAAGTASAADVQSTAQAGVAGASARLPHFDTIQRAFGKHDISGVRAQVGGAATEASAALGAQAYATGDRVAFASAPDLHTAAHEAAHAVQQRNGVVGFQGLGAADDEHERHADAVADAVVAGRSAEPLLDIGRATGSASATAVQRKPAADDLVRNRRINSTPGTAGDSARTGSFLSPEDRAEMLSKLRGRAVAAGARCNDAIESLKIQTLMKRPEDLHWAFAMILDVAAAFVTTKAIKALARFKAGKVAHFDRMASNNMLGGHYQSAREDLARGDRWSSISDESIVARIGLIGGLAKSQAMPILAAALAEDSGQFARLSYLGRLQQTMDIAFQNLGENVAENASDGELSILFEAMDIRYHGSELYQQAISAKVARYEASGVSRVGGRSYEAIERGAKRDVIGFNEVERRVVWVQHEDGQRSLWFQERSSAHTNAQAHAAGGDGDFHLTGVVPKEFWEEAIQMNEQRLGQKVRTIMDSPETRTARGVSPNAIVRAQDSARADSVSPATPVSIVKLFGGS